MNGRNYEELLIGRDPHGFEYRLLKCGDGTFELKLSGEDGSITVVLDTENAADFRDALQVGLDSGPLERRHRENDNHWRRHLEGGC